MNDKIKVMHVFNKLGQGGAETFVLNAYKNINREKIEFDFICQSPIKDSYEEEFKRLGSKVYHLNSFNKANVIKVIIDTKRILKENGPYQAIHLPTQFYSPIYCIAAKLAGVKKIIVHSHNANDKNQGKITRNIYQSISRLFINILSDEKLACGKEAGDFLFGRKKKYTVIYNGIDIDNYINISSEKINKLKEKYNITDELIIGEIARFSEQKNQQFFIRLATELKANRIKSKIILIGEGVKRKEIIKEINRRKLKEYFIVPGSTNKTNAYHALFDIEVMPSLYEGFPVTVIEAQAVGTPCLLSNNISKETKIIKDIVQYEDIEAPIEKWRNDILKLSKNKMDKKYASKIVKERGFDIKQTAKKLEKIYEAN